MNTSVALLFFFVLNIQCARQENEFIATPPIDLSNQDTIYLDARSSEAYNNGHIPNAVNIPWLEIAPQNQSIQFSLLSNSEIQNFFCQRSLLKDKLIIIYGISNINNDNYWGGEGFLFWLLNFSHYHNIEILKGGIANYKGILSVSPNKLLSDNCNLSIDFDSSHVVSTKWLKDNLNNSNLRLIDTRSLDEYNGLKSYGEARKGHIPNAVNFHWKDAFKDSTTLFARDSLKYLIENIFPTSTTFNDDDIFVTYCTGGVRSGFGYYILKLAGFKDVRNYEGSFSAWAKDNSLPIE